MLLHKPLTFKSARLEGLSFTPAEDMVAVVRLAMPLSVEHAEILGIEWTMTGSVARDADIRLATEIESAEFRFPGLPIMKSNLVHRLKLRRTKEASFDLLLITHLPIFHAGELVEFIEHQNKDSFSFTINSLQGELFEGGKRVELSGKDAAAGKDDILTEEFVDEHGKTIPDPRDNAARQTLVTHRGNGKGHALPFDTTIAGAKASAAGKRRSART